MNITAHGNQYRITKVAPRYFNVYALTQSGWALEYTTDTQADARAWIAA